VTILVVAPETDGTARRFAEFAIGRGVPTVVACGFGRVQVTVRAARDRSCRTRIAVDGAEVTAVLTRGLGAWEHEPDAERAFARAEGYAAFWSAIALWPGPVVNRPSARGFFPRLDPLELVGSGAVLPPRTVILNDGDAPGTVVHRLPDWTWLDPAAPRSRFDVVQVEDRDPARTHRVLVAGSEVFDLGGGEAPVHRLAPVLDWLARAGMDFVDFTAEWEDGTPRLAAVSCWPGHDLFPYCEEQVYQALLTRLLR
jgi:hypothetical protein